MKWGDQIIILMGLRSVSAAEDVIGDRCRLGTNSSELLEPRREEREKVWESGPASGGLIYLKGLWF